MEDPFKFRYFAGIVPAFTGSRFLFIVPFYALKNKPLKNFKKKIKKVLLFSAAML